MATSMEHAATDEKTHHSRQSYNTVDLNNIPRQKYFFGAEGRSLMKHVAIAGSLGFLLFGYDQGVLGVRSTKPESETCRGR